MYYLGPNRAPGAYGLKVAKTAMVCVLQTKAYHIYGTNLKQLHYDFSVQRTVIFHVDNMHQNVHVIYSYGCIALTVFPGYHNKQYNSPQHKQSGWQMGNVKGRKSP